ncbi:helix-turn-helix domain-containing protein [uncultured Massilia sp.]|uniref:AraC family transcriptional regulator n=1 Tax=uncultured Massilia sp. TaxID=169973 RepID=UPI0025CE6F48|nr:helix-turn-helix transcriptional regulator [uncultured Massilia sp.]
MPLLNDQSFPSDWVQPDTVPRPVVTYGIMSDRLGKVELAFHRHEKSQFMLTLRGVLSCELEGGLWIVPPQSAIWIPSGVLHSVKFSGSIEGYNAFIDPAVCGDLPASCCTLSTTPLLRELLVRAAHLPLLYPEEGMAQRLVALLLDEMAIAAPGKLHLPMPSDERLRKLVDMIVADPGDRVTMDAWAARAGMSERTLARLISRHTGMSFGRWRQQLRIMLALQLLAKGMSIQQVADRLGYESAGSFVTMFRRMLGAPPGRYMAQQRT